MEQAERRRTMSRWGAVAALAGALLLADDTAYEPLPQVTLAETRQGEAARQGYLDRIAAAVPVGPECAGVCYDRDGSRLAAFLQEVAGRINDPVLRDPAYQRDVVRKSLDSRNCAAAPQVDGRTMGYRIRHPIIIRPAFFEERNIANDAEARSVLGHEYVHTVDLYYGLRIAGARTVTAELLHGEPGITRDDVRALLPIGELRALQWQREDLTASGKRDAGQSGVRENFWAAIALDLWKHYGRGAVLLAQGDLSCMEAPLRASLASAREQLPERRPDGAVRVVFNGRRSWYRQ